MDFVNKLTEQLRDLFLSMTAGARLTAALLLAVVVVSVAFLFKQSTGGPNELLFSEIVSGKQLAQMEAAIAAKKLTGAEVRGSHIYVPRGQRAAYIAAVAEGNALPTDATKLMFDALDGGSVFDSREQKMARIKAARESQLNYVISQMSWVDQATVIFEERLDRGLHSKPKVSASVSVLPLASQEMTSDRARSLQQLVAGSHPDMQLSDVTITNLGDSTMFGGGASGGVAAEDFAGEYYQTRVKYERYVRDQISANLAHIPGVNVQVSAVLDNTLERTLRLVKPETPGVAVREMEETDKSSQQRAANGGRVGVQANGPQRAGAQPVEDSRDVTTTNIAKTQVDSIVGQSEESTTEASLVPKEAWASIGVPRTYVVDVYKQRKLAETGKEPDKLDANELKLIETEVQQSVERLVQPLLPQLAAGKDDFSQVKVQFFDSVKAAELPAPSLPSNAFAWTTQNASSLGMAGLAIFSLLMLRSIVRGGGGNPSPVAGAQPVLRLETGEGADGEPTGADEDAANRQRLKLRKGESLKDDLTSMVRDDPDAAAAILRSWIGQAG